MIADLVQNETVSPLRRAWAHPLLRFVLIAVTSGVAGIAIGNLLADSQLLEPYHPAIEAWSREQGALGFACTMAAFVLGLIGLTTGIFSLFPNAVRRAVKAEPGEDISRALVSQRFGAGAAVAMALMLGVFAVPGLSAMVGVGIVLAALAFLAWATVALMKAGDELYTHVQIQSWAWAGVIIQIGISGWAAMAWFNIAPPLDPRGVMLAMTMVGLITSSILVVRRGFIAG